MDTGFCIEAHEEALEKYGAIEDYILNSLKSCPTDGGHFTLYIEREKRSHAIQDYIDGKGTEYSHIRLTTSSMPFSGI
jgi:hypothetical protein